MVSARRLVRVAEGVVWLARVPCLECGGAPCWTRAAGSGGVGLASGWVLRSAPPASASSNRRAVGAMSRWLQRRWSWSGHLTLDRGRRRADSRAADGTRRAPGVERPREAWWSAPTRELPLVRQAPLLTLGARHRSGWRR